jgi:hypothetical protein
MGPCDFSLKLHKVGPGFENSFTLDTDRCDVESHRYIEAPVRGPDPVTTLIVASGIAVPKIDGTDQGPEDIRFEAFILTDYKLDHQSEFVDGSAYVWLSSISDDDFNHFTAARLEAVTVGANVDGRIQIHLLGSLRGDMAIDRIGYQAFILSSKPRPLSIPARRLNPFSPYARAREYGRFTEG